MHNALFTKRNWLRPLLLLAMFIVQCPMFNGQCSMANLHAQAVQDALYIYRNDGGFNAFFFSDIKRIAYSKVDTLGVEQPDYVVQEVYALDSVFRIPVSAIDSVAFVTPETKYKQDVACTTESDLWKYVIASDSVSWLLLSKNIPSALVPKVGDKLVTLNQTDVLPAGFVGKVATVTETSDGIVVNCAEVDLTEVFDRYVGKVNAIVETTDDGKSRLMNRRVEGKVNKSLKISTLAETLHLTGSYNLSDNFSFDGNGYVGLAVTPQLELRMFLAVGLTTGVNLDMVMRGEAETQLQFGLNGIVTGNFDIPIIKIPVPIPACPLIILNAEAGVFTQAQGSLNVGGTYTTSDRLYSLIQFNSLSEGGRQATATITHLKDTLAWNDVTGKVTLNFGGYAKFSIEAISAKISEAGLRLEAGIREELEAQLKPDEYKLQNIVGLDGELLRLAVASNQEKARKLYDFMDRNVSVNWALFANGQVYAKIGNAQLTFKKEYTISNTPQGGLVPHLGKPSFRLASAAGDSVYIDTPMDRNILLPVKVGYDIYNDQNLLEKELMRYREYFGQKETLTMGVGSLKAGKKYRAYPRIDIFGLTMYGEPTDSFTTDKAMLDIPVKNIDTGSDAGHSSLKIISNVTDIVFSTPDKWLTYYWNPWEQELTVHYEALPAGQNSRKGTIRVVARDGDGKELFNETITVNQVNAFIDLSTTELMVGVEGGTSVINITSTNCKDLQATSKSNFLHPDVSGSTISILVDPNASTEAREGTVIVSGLLESVGVRVERIISVSQAGTMTPEETRLFDNCQLTINVKGTDWIINPQGGTTVKQGDYIVYKSGETKVKGSGDNRTENSWQIELYVDPKDNNMMIDYQLVSGSVSFLQNQYWTTGHGDDEKKHQSTTRCSFNVKDMAVNYVDESYMRFYASSASKNGRTTAATVTDFSYEADEDGKQTVAFGQADINADGSLDVRLYFADGVPVLDANISLIETGGDEGDCHVNITTNDVVQKVEKTTSHDWLTVEDESFYTKVSWTTNTSKADREGYVYLTGTLADGSTITRTITVRQKYERIWDDEWNISEDQKAELPSEAVLAELRNHGMPLYLDTEPPQVNGVFAMNPLALVYAIDPEVAGVGEVEDATYVFNITSLAGINPKAKLLTYSIFPEYNYNSPASEFFCYYGGSGKQFTLSNITTYKDDNPLGEFTATYVTIISGEIDGNQVKDLHYAYVGLDDNGGIKELAIIRDGDGVSPTIKWDPGIEEVDDSMSEFTRLPRQSAARGTNGQNAAKQLPGMTGFIPALAKRWRTLW